MTNKVQKIKQEIERLKEHTAKCGYPGQGEFENGNREGRNWVCDKLLSFIDSLPEEPVDEIIKGNYNERYKRIAQTEQFKKTYCDKSLGKEEPAIEDLEEELHSWMRENCDDNGFFNQMELARHFAEWQREKDIKLDKIDDLEEFAQKWAYSNYHKELDGVNCDCLYSGVKKGAEWQKQKDFKELLRSDMSQFKKCYEKGRADMRDEMTKNAVESEVYYTHMFDENGKPFTDVKFIRRNDNANYGSKAKIMIIKENNK